MSFYTVSILDGAVENTSLIHANKSVSEYVYGREFGEALELICYATRLVVDITEPHALADDWQYYPPDAEITPVPLPEFARSHYDPYPVEGMSIEDRRFFGGLYREVLPKLDTATIQDIQLELFRRRLPEDGLRFCDFRGHFGPFPSQSLHQANQLDG